MPVTANYWRESGEGAVRIETSHLPDASVNTFGLSEDERAASVAICTANGKKADAAFKRIVQGAPRTPATAHRFVSEAVVPIFSDSVSRRAKLPAPDGDEEEIAARGGAGRQALTGFERIAAKPSRSVALVRGKVADPEGVRRAQQALRHRQVRRD